MTNDARMTSLPAWKPLSTTNDLESIQAGLTESVARLDTVFNRDPFMQMLDHRLVSRLALVLAQEGTVWQPMLTKETLRKTPHARLWSDEFISHVESLVWLASGRTDR